MSGTHRSSRHHRDRDDKGDKGEREEPRRSTRHRVPTEKARNESSQAAQAAQASAPKAAKADKGKKKASPSPEDVNMEALSVSSAQSFEAATSIEDSIGVDDWELDILQFSATAIRMNEDINTETGAPLLHWQIHAVGKEAFEVEGKGRSKSKKIEYKPVSIIFDSRRERGPKGEWLASISYVFLPRYNDRQSKETNPQIQH